MSLGMRSLGTPDLQTNSVVVGVAIPRTLSSAIDEVKGCRVLAIERWQWTGISFGYCSLSSTVSFSTRAHTDRHTVFTTQSDTMVYLKPMILCMSYESQRWQLSSPK